MVRPSLASLGALRRASLAFLTIFARYAGRQGIAVAALMAAAATVESAGLVLLIPILDAVVGSSGGHSHLRPVIARLGLRDPLAQLSALLAAFVVLSIVRAFVLYARDVAAARLSSGFVEHQRNAVMQAVASAPWNRVVALRHARITNLLTSEIMRVAATTQYVVQAAVALVMLAVQAVLAFLLSPMLAGASVVLMILGGAALLLSQGRLRHMGAGLVRGNADLLGSASGLLSGLKAAAAQNAQASFVAEFETIQRELRAANLGFQRGQAAGRRVFAIGSGVAGAAIMLGGFALHVPPAVLITLVLLYARMAGPAMQLQQAAQNFFYSLPSFEAMQGFIDEIGHERAAPPAPVVPPPGPIELRAATYLHPGGGGVASASAVIAPGAFVGVFGPSGAGKTTLVDLTIGLLDPQAGEVAVGGLVLDDGARAGWREGVAYVPQDGFLFHDSVRRNLAWGNAMADDAAIWDALTLTGADTVVRRWPGGLDTLVGERGTLLSGGERQRLTLARAILRRPRLLVLDEAMNAIDAESETVLLARLAALDPRPTILMISHRPESLRGCDQIIRVEAGRVEAGRVSG